MALETTIPAGTLAQYQASAERTNNLALAAGAKPGDTVTVNGQAHTVTEPASATSSTPDKNAVTRRVPTHPPLGNPYLIKATTDAAGNYHGQSRDPNALATIEAKVTASGSYNVVQTDASGTTTKGLPGGEVTSAKSSTSTIRGNVDTAVDGGKSSNVDQGENKQNGEASTCSINGTDATTTAKSKKTFAQGGNGPSVVSGDYSLSTVGGGIHFESTMDFTVTAPKIISLASKGSDISLNAKGGNIGITTQGGKTTIDTNGRTRIFSTSDINIISNASITLRVGSSVLLINESGISITAAAVNITKG